MKLTTKHETNNWSAINDVKINAFCGLDQQAELTAS